MEVLLCELVSHRFCNYYLLLNNSRFVDRDMYMRFRGGGVGHVVPVEVPDPQPEPQDLLDIPPDTSSVNDSGIDPDGRDDVGVDEERQEGEDEEEDEEDGEERGDEDGEEVEAEADGHCDDEDDGFGDEANGDDNERGIVDLMNDILGYSTL